MPNKHAAILNPMCDNQDQVEHEMKLMRKVDLKRYYEKHWRAAQRFKKRMSILQTKK